MSIYLIPERRLINSNSHTESLKAARDLLQKESLSIANRRQMIIELLNLVNLGDQNDPATKDKSLTANHHKTNQAVVVCLLTLLLREFKGRNDISYFFI